MQTIVVASGDRSWLEMLTPHLLHSGFSIETAEGGVECVSKVRRFRPYGLVLDAELLWGGPEGVVETVREEFAGGDGPIVVVVGEPPRPPKSLMSSSQRVEYLPRRTDACQIVAAVLGTTKQLSLSFF